MCIVSFDKNPLAIAVSSARYGQGAGQIWLDGLQCTGSENDIIECPSNEIGKHDCSHSHDAGVICQGNNSNCGKQNTNSEAVNF